jgi:hypothetical protein
VTVSQIWPSYGWAAVVAVAIVAGVWTAMKVREPRPVLPAEHVAGAVLIGLFGWESLFQLPGAWMSYVSLTAGLGDVSGDEPQQAYVAALALFGIGSAFAVVGILRRWTWGAVLGIGLAAAVVVMTSLSMVQAISMFGDALGDDAYLSFALGSIGQRAIPALAAIALLAWPLVRRPAPHPEEPARPTAGAPAETP